MMIDATKILRDCGFPVREGDEEYEAYKARFITWLQSQEVRGNALLPEQSNTSYLRSYLRLQPKFASALDEPEKTEKER